MAAIYGPDGHDRVVRDAAFNWDATLDWRKLRVGYLKSEFEKKPEPEEPPKEEKDISPQDEGKRDEERTRKAASRARREYDKRYDHAALEKLRGLGVNLVSVELPKYPYDPMIAILLAEAPAAFDEP